MNRLWGIVAFAILVVAGEGWASIKPKSVFYALYVIDGRAPNGDVRLDFSEGAKLDYEALHEIFTNNLKNSSTHEYRSRLLLGDEVTPDSVLDALDYVASRLKKDDRFLFFYRGHAAMVGDDMIFRLKTKKLGRSKIAERVRAGQQEPRAIFVISDACAPTKETPVVDATTIPVGLTLPDLQTSLPTPLFPPLFLHSAGLIDINSAKPGSDSWSIGGRGLFTSRLIRTLQQPKDKVDRNNDGNVSWEEAFKHADEWTHRYFEKLRAENPGTGLEDAPEQHAVAFSLGEPLYATRVTKVRNNFNVPLRLEVRAYVYVFEKKAYEWQSVEFTVKAKESVSLGKAEANVVQWRQLDLASGSPLEAFSEVKHELYVRDAQDPGTFEIAPKKWLYASRQLAPEPQYYAPLPEWAYPHNNYQPYYNPYGGYPNPYNPYNQYNPYYR